MTFRLTVRILTLNRLLNTAYVKSTALSVRMLNQSESVWISLMSLSVRLSLSVFTHVAALWPTIASDSSVYCLVAIATCLP